MPFRVRRSPSRPKSTREVQRIDFHFAKPQRFHFGHVQAAFCRAADPVIVAIEGVALNLSRSVWRTSTQLHGAAVSTSISSVFAIHSPELVMPTAFEIELNFPENLRVAAPHPSPAAAFRRRGAAHVKARWRNLYAKWRSRKSQPAHVERAGFPQISGVGERGWLLKTTRPRFKYQSGRRELPVCADSLVATVVKDSRVHEHATSAAIELSGTYR